MSPYDPNYKHVKHYCLIGQKAIVLNAEGKILMLKRSKKTDMAKRWSLAGGALDKNEEPIASIRREILEETGLTVGGITPYHVKSRLHENDQIIVIGYVCEAESENVQLNWEHTEYRWCNKEEALALPCTPDGKEFVEMYNNM